MLNMRSDTLQNSGVNTSDFRVYLSHFFVLGFSVQRIKKASENFKSRQGTMIMM